MTLTIDLSPDLERQLTARAHARGQDVQAFALAVLQEVLQGEAPDTNYTSRLSPQPPPDIAARLAALDTIPTYHSRIGLPPLDNTSRSAEPDIYGYSEREDEQLYTDRVYLDQVRCCSCAA